MSKLDFKLLVEQLLLENFSTTFFGDFANDIDIKKIEDFTSNLHTGGQKYQRKDSLLSYKPYWPYADTLEYITLEVNKAIPRFRPDFKSQLEAVVTSLKNIQADIPNVGSSILNNIKQGNFTSEEIIKNSDIITNINNKIQGLLNNKNNYRNFTNTKLAQANNETATIAAEPYLNQSPEVSIINVLKDFGGYDQNIATNIIRYPAEAKYTQRGENIDNMVMTNIIEISKLMLIFYTEWVQQYSIQIIDMLNYASKYTDTVTRRVIINPEMLNQAVSQTVGKKDQATVISKLLSVIGTQIAPTTPLQKLLHDDYLLFVQGKSLLILDPEEYTNIITNDAFDPEKILIKTIKDFDGLPEKGHMIYESYLYLFNNIKKGALPSIWQKGLQRINYATQAASAIASAAGAKLYN